MCKAALLNEDFMKPGDCKGRFIGLIISAIRSEAVIVMRIGGDQVGPRGLAVLAIVAVGGSALAAHGWSERHAVVTPGSLAAGSPATSGTPNAPSSAPGTNHASATATPSAPTATHASTGSAGPLLSSQSYASYAFQVWPGVVSSSAQAAMTGLSISVQRSGQGISVTASVTGQPASPPHVYPTGAKVYVVEASMGDDASNTDYNLGDDGLVVTDSSGRIVQ